MIRDMHQFQSSKFKKNIFQVAGLFQGKGTPLFFCENPGLWTIIPFG